MFDTAPLTERFGMEIRGIDTRSPLPESALDALVALLHERHALVIRSSVLSPRDYVTFSRNFGDPDPSAE